MLNNKIKNMTKKSLIFQIVILMVFACSISFGYVNASGGYKITSGGSGSGDVGSGTTGQTVYYATSGTAVTSTSTIFIDTSSNVGIGASTNLSKLTVQDTLNAATGNESAMQLNYTTNKAAGNDTGLLINQTDTASPGTSLILDLQKAGSSLVNADNSGYLTSQRLYAPALSASAINTTLGLQTIRSFTGADNAIEILGGAGSITNTSGQFNGVVIQPIYNQTSGTAANTDLLINRTETAVGSGVQKLIDAQVGGVSKFSVSNTGIVNLPSAGYLDWQGGNMRIKPDGFNMDFYNYNSSDVALNKNLTITTDGYLKIRNNKWLRASDYAGTGYVNMFKVNASDQIEVGGELSIGDTLGVVTDGGLIRLINQNVTSSAADGTAEGYAFAIDNTDILKVRASSDGAGGVDEKQVQITDGTLAYPGLSFISDANTGLYRTGTDMMSLVAGGVEVARATSTGYLYLPLGFSFDVDESTGTTVEKDGTALGFYGSSSYIFNESTATTTISMENGSGFGSCLKMIDVAGGGFTYCTTQGGTLSCGTVSCE